MNMKRGVLYMPSVNFLMDVIKAFIAGATLAKEAHDVLKGK